jgi:hypothetical protein
VSRGWLPCFERFLAGFQARLTGPSAAGLDVSCFPAAAVLVSGRAWGQGPGGSPAAQRRRRRP